MGAIPLLFERLIDLLSENCQTGLNQRIIGNCRVLRDNHQAVPSHPVVCFAVGAVEQMADTHIATNASVFIDIRIQAIADRNIDQTISSG